MNKSGIWPFEYKVLVKPREVSEKTDGGIIMPEEIQKKEKYGNSYGTIVAIGEIAFTDPDWLERPRVGDNILFDKYAGTFTMGNDGVEYRLINDKEIVARMEERS